MGDLGGGHNKVTRVTLKDVCKLSQHKTLDELKVEDLNLSVSEINRSDIIELNIGERSKILKSRW